MANFQTPENPEVVHLRSTEVAYLGTKLEDYRDAKGKTAKAAVVDQCFKTLRGEREAMKGEPMSRQAAAELKAAIEEFIQRHLHTVRGPQRKPWGIRWTTRLVFQYHHTQTIMYLAKLLVNRKPIPDLHALLRSPETIIPSGAFDLDYMPAEDDEDWEELESVEGPQKTARPFNKYQTATTKLWEVTTTAEKAHYENICSEWLSQGPPLLERRRVAERLLRSRCLDFVVALLNDMNARVFMFIGYEKPDGTRIGADVDLNKELGGCDESFSQAYSSQVKSLLTDWCNWVGNVFDNQEGGENHGSSAKAVFSKYKQLESMDLYVDGTPILPPFSSKRRGIEPAVWRASILRSFFTRHFVIAKGDDPLPESVPLDFVRPRVPWTALKEHVSTCISTEYLPKTLWKGFNDPCKMSAANLKKLYDHLYARQQDPDVYHDFCFDKIPVRCYEGPTVANNFTGYDFVPAKKPKKTRVEFSDDEDGDQHMDYELLRPRRSPSPQGFMDFGRFDRTGGAMRSPSPVLPDGFALPPVPLRSPSPVLPDGFAFPPVPLRSPSPILPDGFNLGVLRSPSPFLPHGFMLGEPGRNSSHDEQNDPMLDRPMRSPSPEITRFDQPSAPSPPRNARPPPSTRSRGRPRMLAGLDVLDDQESLNSPRQTRRSRRQLDDELPVVTQNTRKK
ncbi:hypothetical protein CC2G_004359 [Coprinopsis cinerea AmutBmut pab1-1]|nr:hypothetical protein CC2G_004359 [Coprinopsis cinerea AmutBmut pab1-1]